MSSANLTLVKYYVIKNVIKKLNLRKKIKITADINRIIKHILTVLYFRIYF